MSDPQPLFSLADVNSHLEALFLIADADESRASTALEERLDMVTGRDDTREIIRYLAVYAASLGRQAYWHTPDTPGLNAQDVLADVAKIVSLSAPRPE